MTEKPMEQSNRSGRFTWLWMILSLVVVSGFLAWLAASSRPSSVAVVEEAATEKAAGTGDAANVTVTDLVASIDQYMGKTVQLIDLQVASPLGAQAFWTTLPNGTPFLIKLGPAVVQQGVAPKGGDVVTVVGRVVAMSDSVLAAWQQQGALADEGQKMEAEFATSFVEAAQVQQSSVAAPSERRGE